MMRKPFRKLPFTTFLIAVAALTITGCPAPTPLGSPDDCYRPRGNYDITIDVAPAGDAILFNGEGSGGRDLYILSLEDSSVVRVADTPDYEVAPSFSPDGAIIVYAAGTPGSRADHIFKIRRDGTGKEQLTDEDANDTTPVFSPDGTLIAFARDKTHVWGGLAANWEFGGVICVMNADGTNERQLTPDEVFAVSPRFSADGQRVLYSTESGLYSVPITGGEEPTRLGPCNRMFDLLPGSARVVFSEGEFSPDHEIFVSGIDGSEKIRVTDSEVGCFHPSMNRVGDTIFFVIEEWPPNLSAQPKSSLWQVGADGESLKQLADIRLFYQPMKWRPEKVE